MTTRRPSLRSVVAVSAVALVLAASAFGVSSTFAGQPHMNSALNELSSALNQLQDATPDKAGHRVQAMELVREAITQTTEGMAAGAI